MAALTAYLEIHRDRYTEPALRRAALDAGYSASEIDAAFARLAGGRAMADPGRPPFSSVTAAATFIVFIVAVWLGLSAVESIGRTTAPDLPVAPVAWLGVAIIGTLLWWWGRATHPSFARGIATGVVVVTILPLVLVLAVFGICVITGSPLLLL